MEQGNLNPWRGWLGANYNALHGKSLATNTGRSLENTGKKSDGKHHPLHPIPAVDNAG